MTLRHRVPRHSPRGNELQHEAVTADASFCWRAGEDMIDDEGTADELSDSEGDEDRLGKYTQKPAPSAAKPEVAHLGMQPRKALSGKAEFGKGQKKNGPEQDTMSIAEQECLALDMLSRR